MKKIIIIILFYCFSRALSNEITEEYLLEKYYGPEFQVDKEYPLEISYDEYCHYDRNYQLQNTTKPKEYQSNLWLALIHTVPSKINNIINTRSTWCKQSLQKRYGFKCVFILVESTVQQSGLQQELLQMNQTYHDIYFIEMPGLQEQWFTLQQKNINSYILALDLFPEYSFYARVDDQIMVTVDVLSTLLLEFTTKSSVIGDIITHRPMKNPQNKYYDPLALHIPYYFPFPAGYLSLFSKDIIQFIANWDNYYTFAPSSLEDPGFGHWIYKYAITHNIIVEIIKPKRWGGNVKSMLGDYIVYHSQRGRLNQTLIFNQQQQRGYLQE